MRFKMQGCLVKKSNFLVFFNLATDKKYVKYGLFFCSNGLNPRLPRAFSPELDEGGGPGLSL